MEANFLASFRGQFFKGRRPIFSSEYWPPRGVTSIAKVPDCLQKGFARLRGQFFVPTRQPKRSDFWADFFGPKNARIARDIPSENIGQKIGLEIGPRWAGCQPRILGSILVCSEGAKCNGHTEPGDVSSSEREAPAIMAQSTNR